MNTSLTPVRLFLCALFLSAVVGFAGCSNENGRAAEEPALETAADTLAYRVVQAMGGLDAWPSVHYVRFDFIVERDDNRALRARHLWNRMTGDYRLERPLPGDSLEVVLFNVNTRAGRVFVEGVELAPDAAAPRLERAYRSFINDTYWLSMPMKLFDPGVNRSVDADSSSAGMDVLALAFDDVGLTPGDRYWIAVDESGMVRRWTYLLQNADTPRTYEWHTYREFDTPHGKVKLAERRTSGGSAIVTDHLALPEQVDPALFASATPVLD